MKKVLVSVASFAMVLMLLFSCVMFAGCNEDPIVGTYKLTSMGGYQLGEDYYGLVLDRDCDVLVLKADGTFEESQKNRSSSIIHTDVYTGNWEHVKGNMYSLTALTLNGDLLEHPSTETYYIENGAVFFNTSGFIVTWTKV